MTLKFNEKKQFSLKPSLRSDTRLIANNLLLFFSEISYSKKNYYFYSFKYRFYSAIIFRVEYRHKNN